MITPSLFFYGLELFSPTRIGPHSYVVRAQKTTVVPAGASVNLDLKCMLLNNGCWPTDVHWPSLLCTWTTHRLLRRHNSAKPELDFSEVPIVNSESHDITIKEGDPLLILHCFPPQDEQRRE